MTMNQSVRQAENREAIEFLAGAYRISQQIGITILQIEALQDIAARLSPRLEKDPVVHSRNVTALQDNVNRIIEEEERLNAQISGLVAKKREIGEVLARLKDPFQRLVLEKRYICFQLWKEIADDLNCSLRLVHIRHNEAVSAVQEILREGEWKFFT